MPHCDYSKKRSARILDFYERMWLRTTDTRAQPTLSFDGFMLLLLFIVYHNGCDHKHITCPNLSAIHTFTAVIAIHLP